MVVAAASLAGLTIVRAIANRISGRVPSGREIDALRDEVLQLRAELDEVHARLGDVEEIQNRLDFAERMIGQLKGRPALPGGEG